MRSQVLLLLVVMVILWTVHPSAAVWWDPWTWFKKEWRPISELKRAEIHDAGYYTVAQYNYKHDLSPPDAVKFVRVVKGRYRDNDDIRREFELVILCVGPDGKKRNYDTHMVRIVPEDRTRLVGTVSDRYAFAVVKFQPVKP